MGGGGISGDLTISSKVFLKDRRPFRIKRWDGSQQLVDRPTFWVRAASSQAGSAQMLQTPTPFEFIDTTMVRLPIRFARAAST